MDICGAMALKCHFDNVIMIYIKRDRRTLIESILKKNQLLRIKQIVFWRLILKRVIFRCAIM